MLLFCTTTTIAQPFVAATIVHFTIVSVRLFSITAAVAQLLLLAHVSPAIVAQLTIVWMHYFALLLLTAADARHCHYRCAAEHLTFFIQLLLAVCVTATIVQLIVRRMLVSSITATMARPLLPPLSLRS